MSYEDYRGALRLGQKEYRACMSRGEYPYLQVLDDLLDYEDTLREEYLGLVTVPVELVAGTKGEGRHAVFARNFMPLLGENTEFAGKWINLSRAHLEEGIRDPVKAYEFMNRFYIQEGNKRFSVLKYFGAAAVPANVTRLVPQRQDTVENRIYYEFMDFYRLTKVNYIWFSQTGRFKKLLSLVKTAEPVWNDDDRSGFLFAFDQFRRIFRSMGGQQLAGATEGDAFLAYCTLYGYEPLKKYQEPELRRNLAKSWKEVAAQAGEEPVALELSPSAEPPKTSLLDRVLKPKPTKLKVAFLYEKTAETSGWTSSHEQGRRRMEKALAGRVETCCYDGVMPAEAGAAVEKAIREGAGVVFTTTPKFMEATFHAALEHPEVKLLNCALYSPHPSIRTYYGRMYEAKFISGAVAGALSETGRIGYVADYPIYGSAASVNAFALGARLVNSRARVFLEWASCRSLEGIRERFVQVGVDVVSNQDRLSPRGDRREVGLYRMEGGEQRRVAATVWNWGRFYELILNSILNGGWRTDADREGPRPVTGNLLDSALRTVTDLASPASRTAPKAPPKAINYWWGMSAGVVDIHVSKNLPLGTRRLAGLLRQAIVSDAFHVFSGELYSQAGLVHREGDLTPEEIVKMDWLCRNVEGSIPLPGELTEEARGLVSIQGLRGEELA